MSSITSGSNENLSGVHANPANILEIVTPGAARSPRTKEVGRIQPWSSLPDRVQKDLRMIQANHTAIAINRVGRRNVTVVPQSNERACCQLTTAAVAIGLLLSGALTMNHTSVELSVPNVDLGEPRNMTLGTLAPDQAHSSNAVAESLFSVGSILLVILMCILCKQRQT